MNTAETKQRARLLWRLGWAALILAFLVFGITSFAVYSNWTQSRRDAQLARSGRVYARTLTNILEGLKDAETGQRGYVLTGKERYLEPYTRALKPIQDSLADLSAAALERPDQRSAIEHIQSQARLKLTELAQTIELRKTKGFDAAREEILTDLGKAAMDEVRLECRNASDLTSQDIAKRAEDAANHQRTAILIAAGGSGLLFFFMTAGFLILTSGASQQAHLAERLADSKEIFETTLTSIVDGVLAADTTGRITFINPEASRIIGWSRADAIDKHLDEIFRVVNQQSRLPSESPFDKVMRTGNVAALANRSVLIRSDGTEVPIDDSGAPIRDIHGKINGVVLVFRNIAERRQAEDALLISHNEVLKANEELRQFSYAATHDLQEPLRTIVVFSQLLSRNHKQALDERGLYLLQTLEDAAHRMSLLIDDLLAFTRAGGIDSPSTRAVVNPDEVLNNTLLQLRATIDESGAVITHQPLPMVLSNPAQLSQVFQNLLSNAIKYRSPDRQPQIHISAVIEGDCAIFCVTDNGIGFKQEYADRIFLLFQRLHGRSIPGTGIGLALCRRIVERHGGRIWAQSKENIGTSFYFTFPIAADHVSSSV